MMLSNQQPHGVCNRIVQVNARIGVVAKLAGLFLLFILSFAANAHKPSDSYLTLTSKDKTIDVRWDVSLRDLDTELGLDVDGDGVLTWGEIRNRHRDIDAFVMPNLQLRTKAAKCETEPAFSNTRLAIDVHSDAAYAVVEFKVVCPIVVRSLEVEYRLFAAMDPTHRGIVRIVNTATPSDVSQASNLTAVLDPASAPRTFSLAEASLLVTLREFIVEGIWHIWIGFDHILFLIALLLTSVLVPVQGRIGLDAWRGATTLRGAVLDMVKIVTAFTVAHSITLTLAVLELVSLPSRLVESVIAMTVLLSALNNLYPVLRQNRWIATFFFGLIHGFGFASVLKDLGLAKDALGWSLLGFNVGVEIGQLVIVGVFFPFAYWLRNSTLYRRGVLIAGSAAIAIIATLWFVERAFDLKLISGN